MQALDLLAGTGSSSQPNELNGTASEPAADLHIVDAEGDMRAAIDRQKRNFDLAMTASKMGTWRYTIADNICLYDENAQRLYGLSAAAFLHDEEGVKAKFHDDDLELMWSRVGAALDPNGDGRYEVEYRVKQSDGAWRWLSAWGLVEFDGDGPDRRPVAITGASRDLTDRKEAEAFQRLLLNELKHRVKNTLSTVQAIITQTLGSATDFESAKDALEQRFVSMAKAHDVLIANSWTGASLKDVVSQTLEAFSPSQTEISGDDVEISSRQTLGMSMALHELATNAAKYGALSCPEGKVAVQWAVHDNVLQLDWREQGGPRVSPPTRKGFGTRLLERLLVGELGGTITLDYQATGVHCQITAALAPAE
jgi:two-component sensor histidine kinase